jgi:hypothetical protein
VKVTASVLGMPSVAWSDVDVIIGGTAGSVIVSREQIETARARQDTYYKLPMAVLVTDASVRVSGVTDSEHWPNRWPPDMVRYEKTMHARATCICTRDSTGTAKRMRRYANATGSSRRRPRLGFRPRKGVTGDDWTAVFDLTYVRPPPRGSRRGHGERRVYGTETDHVHLLAPYWTTSMRASNPVGQGNAVASRSPPRHGKASHPPRRYDANITTNDFSVLFPSSPASFPDLGDDPPVATTLHRPPIPPGRDGARFRVHLCHGGHLPHGRFPADRRFHL